MGMEQTVSYGGQPVPGWETIAGLLAQRGLVVQMRMIDGQLAFPDEVPPAEWRELRVGTTQGMVTLRREGASIVLVVWGNADLGLRQVWNALAWACAEAGGGRVQTGQGEMDAPAFAQRAEMPGGF
jgi:hypothetical protein